MIKIDINLIPKKKKMSRSVVLGIPLFLLLAALILSAGVYLPNRLLDIKKVGLIELQNELKTYGDVQTAYLQKLQDLELLNKKKVVFENFFSTGRETIDIANLINSVKPSTIVLLQYSYTIDGVTISGTAKEDISIAKFEDSLWKTKVFSNISLKTISGEPGTRTFSFTLTHNVTEAAGGENK